LLSAASWALEHVDVLDKLDSGDVAKIYSGYEKLKISQEALPFGLYDKIFSAASSDLAWVDQVIGVFENQANFHGAFGEAQEYRSFLYSTGVLAARVLNSVMGCDHTDFYIECLEQRNKDDWLIKKELVDLILIDRDLRHALIQHFFVNGLDSHSGNWYVLHGRIGSEITNLFFQKYQNLDSSKALSVLSLMLNFLEQGQVYFGREELSDRYDFSFDKAHVYANARLPQISSDSERILILALLREIGREPSEAEIDQLKFLVEKNFAQTVPVLLTYFSRVPDIVLDLIYNEFWNRDHRKAAFALDALVRLNVERFDDEWQEKLVRAMALPWVRTEARARWRVGHFNMLEGALNSYEKESLSEASHFNGMSYFESHRLIESYVAYLGGSKLVANETLDDELQRTQSLEMYWLASDEELLIGEVDRDRAMEVMVEDPDLFLMNELLEDFLDKAKEHALTIEDYALLWNLLRFWVHEGTGSWIELMSDEKIDIAFMSTLRDFRNNLFGIFKRRHRSKEAHEERFILSVQQTIVEVLKNIVEYVPFEANSLEDILLEEDMNLWTKLSLANFSRNFTSRSQWYLFNKLQYNLDEEKTLNFVVRVFARIENLDEEVKKEVIALAKEFPFLVLEISKNRDLYISLGQEIFDVYEQLQFSGKHFEGEVLEMSDEVFIAYLYYLQPRANSLDDLVNHGVAFDLIAQRLVQYLESFNAKQSRFEAWYNVVIAVRFITKFKIQDNFGLKAVLEKLLLKDKRPLSHNTDVLAMMDRVKQRIRAYLPSLTTSGCEDKL